MQNNNSKKRKSRDDPEPAQIRHDGIDLHTSKKNKTGFTGVEQKGQRFVAIYGCHGAKVRLGSFPSAVSAAVAYARYVQQSHDAHDETKAGGGTALGSELGASIGGGGEDDDEVEVVATLEETAWADLDGAEADELVSVVDDIVAEQLQQARAAVAATASASAADFFDLGGGQRVRGVRTDALGLIGRSVDVPNSYWAGYSSGTSRCDVVAYTTSKVRFEDGGGLSEAYILLAEEDNYCYPMRPQQLRAFVEEPPRAR